MPPMSNIDLRTLKCKGLNGFNFFIVRMKVGLILKTKSVNQFANIIDRYAANLTNVGIRPYEYDLNKFLCFFHVNERQFFEL